MLAVSTCKRITGSGLVEAVFFVSTSFMPSYAVSTGGHESGPRYNKQSMEQKECDLVIPIEPEKIQPCQAKT
jgi:hypothetical protein